MDGVKTTLASDRGTPPTNRLDERFPDGQLNSHDCFSKDPEPAFSEKGASAYLDRQALVTAL